MQSSPSGNPVGVADYFGDAAETCAKALAARLDAAVAEPAPPKGPRYVVEKAAKLFDDLDVYRVKDEQSQERLPYVAYFTGSEGEQRARDYADFLNSQP